VTERLDRRRLTALLMAVALLHGLVYALIVPLWQAPDEPGHYEYAQLLAERKHPLTRADRSPALEREIIASLSDHDFWHWVGSSTVEPLPASFAEDPFLLRSGRQVGDEPPLYYLVPAIICHLTPSIELRVRLIRFYSLLLTTLAAGVAALAAWELFPNDRWLAAAVASLQALLPMVAFIGSSLNNDALALLSGNLLFWALIRACRRGLNRKRAAGLVFLNLLALGSKKTAAFLFPLTLITLPLLGWWRGWRPGRRTAALLLALVLIGLVLWLGRGPAPSVWTWGELPSIAGRTDREVHQGQFAFRAGGEGPQRLVESIPAETVEPWRGQVITLTAWLRSEEGVQSGRLALIDEGDESHVSRHYLRAEPHWTQEHLTHTLSSETGELRVAVAAGWSAEGGQRFYFDDLHLETPNGEELLRNGGAEIGARWIEQVMVWPPLQPLRTAYQAWTGRSLWNGGATQLARLLEGRSYEVAALRRCGLYLLLTFAGFWANFGWLTLPLPVAIYASLALMCGIAGLGLLRQTVHLLRGRAALPEWQRRALLLLALGLVLSLAQTFLPMIGRNWQPQGRYLFPALVPISVALCLGLRSWAGPRLRPPLWAVYWVGLFAFDLYCLLGRVAGCYGLG